MNRIDLASLRSVYFLGVGGIGMSALAHFFLQQGKKVAGYDLTETHLTQTLANKGANIIYKDAPETVPNDIDIVIYTPAVPKTTRLYQYFIQKNIPILKRSEVLGIICSTFPTIAIAGTHGKTTTTAMTAHLLEDENILAFVGGVMKKNNNNYLIKNDVDTVVVEADEFDRSFLTLYPTTAVVTCVEADHLDIYGSKQYLQESFQQFVNQVDDRGAVIVYEKFAHDIAAKPSQQLIKYGFSEDCHYEIKEVKLSANHANFTLIIKDNNLQLIKELPNIRLGITGNHNVLNSVAALAAAKMHTGADIETLAEKLGTFQGIKRRFDVRIEREDFVYIDDYAHHPTELTQCIESVKSIYPTKKITGIFQPHLYTRTRDFADEFAQALALLDEVILLDIYPARELPIEGVTSQMLLDRIPHNYKKILAPNEVVGCLLVQKPEVLLTLGAGNIDLLVPAIEGAFGA